MASGSASSAPMPEADWAPSSWPWMTELHREVALKQILDHHADDPTSRQRFLLEAEVTGGLEHPGIVPVYGLGTYGDGRPYYAMRFIRGDCLKEAIEHFHADEAVKNDPGRRSLELRKLLRRFLDVCNAIEYAHSRGVLHRDIKPGNIIVGKHGETLVVDWGLAKPLGRVEPGVDSGERTLIPSSASGSASTLPGSALGTPAYMSPEQSEGDLEHLGPRSDVYSLGATLYCLLTGKPPFEGDLADVIRGVQKGQFPPPRQLDPSIDRALEAVCLKAMALKPADRYGSPKALAEDVERWMADEPVRAWREPWTRALIALAGAAPGRRDGGRGGGAGGAGRDGGRAGGPDPGQRADARTPQPTAKLAASNQRERARFALAQEAIRTFHTGVSEDILLKQEEFKALRTKLLREAREFYRKLEGLLQGHEDRDSRMSLGRAYLEVGQLTRQLDSIEEALKVHERAVDLFEALSREDPADTEPRHMLARSLQSLALVLSTVGRRDEAHTAMERSRALFRTLAEAEPAARKRQAEWGRSEIFYSGSLLAKGRYDEALGAIQRAWRSWRPRPERVLHPRISNLSSWRCTAPWPMSWTRAAARMKRSWPTRRPATWAKRCSWRTPRTPPPATSWSGPSAIWGSVYGTPAAGTRRSWPSTGRGRCSRRREVLTRLSLCSVRTRPGSIPRAPKPSSRSGATTRPSSHSSGPGRPARCLIKANPAVTRNREQLIRTNRQIADIHRRAGRMSELLASLKQAREFAASLVHAHPENREYRLDLARHDTDLGDLLGAMGKPAEALDVVRRGAGDPPQDGAGRPIDTLVFGPTWPTRSADVGIALQKVWPARRGGIGLPPIARRSCGG